MLFNETEFINSASILKHQVPAFYENSFTGGCKRKNFFKNSLSTGADAAFIIYVKTYANVKYTCA